VKRRVFSAVTVVLLLITAWMVWANVLSDDTALRARAGQLARDKAGCGDKCKLIGMQGDRGMLDTTIEYTFDPQGRFNVVCRRPAIAFGDHVCTATKP
jgi:hypothetical protein